MTDSAAMTDPEVIDVPTPHTFSAVVTDIRLESRIAGQARWQMTLSQTHFAAGQHGTLEAVARSGTRLHIPVLNVVLDPTGDLWHVVEKPLAAGTDVVGIVTP